jgi:hypothetical protein
MRRGWGVRVIGVDEHRWAHTRSADGEGYVTVIVDLTPVLDGAGPGHGPGGGRPVLRLPGHRRRGRLAAG